MNSPQIPPQTELELLRRRNVELSLLLDRCQETINQYQHAISELIHKCRDWQQIAIAAEAKAKALESSVTEK